MSEQDILSKRARLLNQKQQLEVQEDLAYNEMNLLYSSINEQFEILYPYFKELEFFHFDLTNVDFYFGEIACDYRGDNYSLSNKLFEFNEKLIDVNAFDLTTSQLVKIYNILVTLYHEICGQDFTVIRNYKLTTNEIINKIKILTEHFAFKSQNKCDNTQKKLVNSVQKVYVLLDFALYEDEAHFDLRKLCNHYIEVQNTTYDKISEYRESISKIDEVLDSLPNDTFIEEVYENIFSEEKMTLKEKIINTLGAFGIVLYFLVQLTVAILPFVMIVGGFFLSFILIFVNYWLPITSVVFWIWGLVCAIKGVQDIWAIMYYIAFVVIWIPFFVSTILSIFSKRRR